jgi:sulfate adenylyltransferase
VALYFDGEPLALLEVREVFPLDREAHSRQVFGTTDAKHPGVARLNSLQPHLVAGPITMARDLPSRYEQYRLTPLETRTLFELKGWRTVVGFQTRNVPHIGHEYVQKSALTFVDGLFINPVIGRKKSGDFTDDAIIEAYEVLTAHYYPKERSVLAILETEMQYAGPREAIFHATVRKNFGCTHFIVGRDHAGVGNFYAPYAAQEIFDQYPDIGITPLFFTAFFFCKRCDAVMNEKTCPHGHGDHLEFSGSLLRNLGRSGGDVSQLVRREVALAIAGLPDPFVP